MHQRHENPALENEGFLELRCNPDSVQKNLSDLALAVTHRICRNLLDPLGQGDFTGNLQRARHSEKSSISLRMCSRRAVSGQVGELPPRCAKRDQPSIRLSSRPRRS